MLSESTVQAVNTLDWILDGMLRRVPHGEHAVVFSADGMPLACSRNLDNVNTEFFAAAGSAIQSLALAVGVMLDKGGPRHTLVELVEGYLVIAAVEENAHLGLLATDDAELGLVAREMVATVPLIRHQLRAMRQFC